MTAAYSSIKLICPAKDLAGQILEYRNEFSTDAERITYIPQRIPGLDHLEEYGSVSEWLDHCEEQKDRISWFLSVRKSDGRIVGACCLRHRLEYDDDDPEFASNIGYSVRPSERGKGYGNEQMRLLLEEARKAGLDRVRVICVDSNEKSRKVILNNGGRYIDSLYGDESGLTVLRYDIEL